MIPLFQVVQPIVLEKELNYQPFPTGPRAPGDVVGLRPGAGGVAAGKAMEG